MERWKFKSMRIASKADVGPGALHPVELLNQLTLILRTQVGPAEQQCFGFQHHSQTVNLPNILFAQAYHKHAAARLIGNEPLFLQLVKSLPNGSAADLQLTSQFTLIQPIARLEPAGKYSLNQHVSDVLRRVRVVTGDRASDFRISRPLSAAAAGTDS